MPTASEFNRMNWINIKSEPSGLVNISRFRKKARPLAPIVTRSPKDVVFARTTIVSDRDQIKKLSFGYSDDVVIYLNGRAVYSGRSGFVSRYPGYLGIVGVDNDSVYLNLKKGRNELVLAVSEVFGGWGYICRLDEMSGITL